MFWTIFYEFDKFSLFSTFFHFLTIFYVLLTQTLIASTFSMFSFIHHVSDHLKCDYHLLCFRPFPLALTNVCFTHIQLSRSFSCLSHILCFRPYSMNLTIFYVFDHFMSLKIFCFTKKIKKMVSTFSMFSLIFYVFDHFSGV